MNVKKIVQFLFGLLMASVVLGVLAAFYGIIYWIIKLVAISLGLVAFSLMTAVVWLVSVFGAFLIVSWLAVLLTRLLKHNWASGKW